MAQTMSPYKIDAIIRWQEETEQRTQAIKNAEIINGESEEAYIERIEAMPQPRTWLEFAVDPLEDGAPKDPSADAPGMLDPNDPLNSDSLLLSPEWSDVITGEDFDTVYFYKQSQKGRQGLLTKVSEGIYPSIVHKTAAADYVPSLWNIFQNKDGSRYEGHEVDNFWMRSLFHGTGAVWNLLMFTGIAAIGSYGARKLFENTVIGVIEAADEGIEEIMD